MKEIRSASIEGGEELTLIGYPILFNVPATINDPSGAFIEIIDPHALDHTDLHDVSLRVEHQDKMIPLARSPRTLQLSVDDKGLRMVASLAEDNRSVYNSVKRGDITGLSFGFTVSDGGSHYDVRTNVRHITDIKKVYECSLCVHPAYETSVEARSQMQDAKARQHDTDQLLCHINELLLKLG